MMNSSFQSQLLEYPLQISTDLHDFFYGSMYRLLYGAHKPHFLRCLLWITPKEFVVPFPAPQRSVNHRMKIAGVGVLLAEAVRTKA